MTATGERIIRKIRSLPPTEQRAVCAHVIELAGHLDYGGLTDAELTFEIGVEGLIYDKGIIQNADSVDSWGRTCVDLQSTF